MEDFVCTNEQIELSTEKLGQENSVAEQGALIDQLKAPVCTVFY